MSRPVWLLSMDSEQFNAPPTTTAALSAYYQQYGGGNAAIELVHFQAPEEIAAWRDSWLGEAAQSAADAAKEGMPAVLGFSFYTWNAAEFLALAKELKAAIPELLIIAGGPHVQQAEDYLGVEAIDLVFIGEAEETFQEFLDCRGPEDWPDIPGLALLRDGELLRTAERARCRDLERFPSPLDVLTLTGADGEALYESIAYETSRGCPFRCAFCEWGTGAIGSKMYQWPMERIERDWRHIVASGIKDIWLADSNFGALKQDLDKAKLIVELKQTQGLPLSFATSWSKKHSRQVQEIALLLHRNHLLPHYQLALQTLTPEALRLSNRQNMSSNEYEPIAKRMSEEGVPIAAELIWGLPGDNLPDFERNLDTLLATFPNINIFGYTLLPGTEFYERREEYQIEAIPVAGYGKAKGEYVVACHSFDRNQGEEGYFLISAHLFLIHGHVLPLTTRWLALQARLPVSPLLREILRAIVGHFGSEVPDLDPSDRMSVYEQRNGLYLEALKDQESLYALIAQCLRSHHERHGSRADEALQVLALDRALCPRWGGEQRFSSHFAFNAREAEERLAAMELPSITLSTRGETLNICHPGGVGEILHDADGGSWLRGTVEAEAAPTEVEYLALA